MYVVLFYPLLYHHIMWYKPSATVLQRYAQVLIEFALADGTWAQPWEIVLLQIPESARDFAPYLQEQVLKSWAHPLVRILPEWLGKRFLELANEDQLLRWPQELMLAEVAQVDHRVRILSQYDKHEMDGADSSKMMQRTWQTKFYIDALNHKEQIGRMHRTGCLYGTQAMADEVWMSIEEYWQQIIDACFLDYEDPIDQWKQTFAHIHAVKEKLNSLTIDHLHITWEDVDLIVQLWPHRKRLGWSGRNIPSFEIFVSPDWRGTQWWISFNQPLYRYGTLIQNVKLEFENGIVTKASADQWQQALQDMIAVTGANKVWEYSLTDRRMSRITRFMGETLYDENVWWKYGNTHLALGNAYKDSFPWDLNLITPQQWKDMGYNESVIHTDIVSTSDRVVVARLSDGKDMLVYQWGEFML